MIGVRGDQVQQHESLYVRATKVSSRAAGWTGPLPAVATSIEAYALRVVLDGEGSEEHLAWARRVLDRTSRGEEQ